MSYRFTDRSMSAIMPYAAQLADAVARRDEDAAYTAWCNAVDAGLHEAGIPITAVHAAVAYCVAIQAALRERQAPSAGDEERQHRR